MHPQKISESNATISTPNRIIQYLCILIVLFSSCNTSRSENTEQESTKTEPIPKEALQAKITSPVDGNSSGKIENIYIGCGYNYDLRNHEINYYYPDLREVDQIKTILTYSGIPLNFEILKANIQNAVATIINDKRYIIYDPELLKNIDRHSSTYWSSMSILAHEIGHHLSGHTLTVSSDKLLAELEADKFSGFVLYKMGATLEEASRAMSLLGSNTDTQSHPNKHRRLLAIKTGWEEANALRYESAVPPPPTDILSFEGGTDEFTPELFSNNEDTYTSLLAANGHGTWTSDFWEGIILEGQYEGQYLMLITKVGPNDLPEYENSLGQKMSISLSWGNLSRVGISWLNEIMIPGRKIKFAFTEEGTAPSRSFCYVKYLPSK